MPSRYLSCAGRKSVGQGHRRRSNQGVGRRAAVYEEHDAEPSGLLYTEGCCRHVNNAHPYPNPRPASPASWR